MNNLLSLSVVIPTYNMEEFLSRCINSLIENERLLNDLEVIIVNDGSKDNSLKIARNYEEKYPKSVKVIDKPNGNYGSCVNAGFKIATGKYFRILDADDWVDSKGLQILISKLKEIDVDVVFTHMSSEFASDGVSLESKLSSKRLNEIISVDSSFLLDIDVWNDMAMHKMTYRTQMLRDFGFYHTEGISYTDLEYVYYPLRHLKSVYFSDSFLYKYYIGREGQTISVEARVKNVGNLRLILDRMLNDKIDDIKNISLKKWVIETLVFNCSTYYHNLLILQPKSIENKKMISNFDLKVKKFDENLYEKLDTINVFGIKYIHIWRRFKIRIMTLPTYNFYQKIKKILAPKNVR